MRIAGQFYDSNAAGLVNLDSHPPGPVRFLGGCFPTSVNPLDVYNIQGKQKNWRCRQLLLAKPKASTGTRFCLLVLLLLLLQIEIAFAQARTRGNGKTCCALRRALLQVVGGKEQRDKNVLVVVVANGLAGAVGAPRAFDGCCPSSCARADPRLLSPATDSSRHVRRLLPRRLGDCKCWEGERGIESDALTDTHAYVLCFVSAASSPHQPPLQSRATDSAAATARHSGAFFLMRRLVHGL